MKKTIKLTLSRGEKSSWRNYGVGDSFCMGSWICSDTLWEYFPKLNEAKNVCVTVSTSRIPASRRVQFVKFLNDIDWIDTKKGHRPLWENFSQWISDLLGNRPKAYLYFCATKVKSPVRKTPKR